MNSRNIFARRALSLLTASALGLGSAGFSGTLAAATATSSLPVTATVAANCSITTAAVGFGAYDPAVTNASAALDNTGSVTVTCTSGATTKVTLGQGVNANTGSTDAAPLRRMLNGTTNFLAYSLYSDTGRATVWGNDAATGVAHTGVGTATTITVYGRVAGGQNVPAGAYTDTVVATITF